MKRCRHTEGPQHDCAYVDAVNALLDEADALARAVAPPQAGRSVFNMAKRDRAFTEAMGELCEAAGLRKRMRRMVAL